MQQFFYYAMRQNPEPSLTNIMDGGDQYFEKNILCLKIFIMPCVKF